MQLSRARVSEPFALRRSVGCQVSSDPTLIKAKSDDPDSKFMGKLHRIFK